jgi:MFS family permease
MAAHAAFRLYLAAFLAFDLAAQMQSVAVAWQVYTIRHSAFDLGLVGLVLFAPSLLLAPVTGLIADRFDRRRVVAVASVVQIAVCAALVPLAGRHGAGALATTLAVLAVSGAARALRWPAASSLLAQVVAPDDYMRASTAASALREVVRIGGPALGGVLVALGAAFAYAAAGTAFALGAALVVAIPLQRRTAAASPVSWAEVFAGLHYLRAKPVLAGAVTLDLFALFFGGATALLPVYAAQIFHAGAAGFGVLRASIALGAGACALALVRRPIRRFAGPRLLAAVACFGAATIVFGVSTSLWIAIPALALLGAADMVSMAIRDALVALGTPDEMRGRVYAVEGVLVVASNELGEFESGTLAAFIGAVPAVVLGGAATLAVVALWAWRNPSLRRADAVAPAGPAATSS